MKKQRKPLSTKNPPNPTDNHNIIENWMDDHLLPGIKPIVKEIDRLIIELIPKLQYSVKWGNAFYGSQELGWFIEVAAFAVSVNIVFLCGANFDTPPPLGDDIQSRYIKLKTIKDVNDPKIKAWIQEAGRTSG